jgi:hypothetical protein
VDAAERSAAIAEIERLKARYFRAMDSADWDGLAAAFAADAVMDMSGSGGRVADDAVLSGNERIARVVRRFLEGARSIHRGQVQEIELTGADTARGVWSMTDQIFWPDGAVDEGAGTYYDEYRRVDGVWLIASTRLVRPE